MEGKSLEDLKTLIVDLYSRNRSQEKIMECLRWHGIETRCDSTGYQRNI